MRRLPESLRWTIALLSVFVVVMNYIFAPSNILSWDVFGYYLYLPLTFIRHDLGLANYEYIQNIIDTYHSTATFYQANQMPDGHWVMKYTMGLSILYFPFFLVGWLFAEILGYPVDGFSLPFQVAIHAGGIVYSIIGLWFTTKVLHYFFKPRIAILSLLLIVFSTNYLVHITMYGQNAMSHNYLFTGLSMVLWFTIRWHQTHRTKYGVYLGIVIGLMALSRPTELVVLMIPVFWGVYSIGTLREKIQLLFARINQVALFAMVLLLIGSLQLIYWKIYAGKFLYNSYGGNPGEGLELFRPFTLKFLFSFRKGWLLYTPLMIFSIAGFYRMYQKNRAIFYALFGYFLINLWVVSSWSNWWYAQSFSQRAMVTSYPVMAVSLGYFLSWAFDKKRKWISVLTGVVLFLVLLLNIFQTIQFHKGVLHPDRMTRAYYLATFGKLTVSEEEKKLLLVNRNFNGQEIFANEGGYRHRVFKVLDFDNGRESRIKHSGCCSERLDSAHNVSSFIEGEFRQLTDKDHAWLRISLFVFPSEKDIGNNTIELTANFFHKGDPYKFRAFNFKTLDLKPGVWNKVTFDYLTPEVRRDFDKFRTVLWYRGSDTLYIDDFKVEVFEPK